MFWLQLCFNIIRYIFGLLTLNSFLNLICPYIFIEPIWYCLIVFNWVFLFLTACKSPGYLQGDQIQYYELYQKYEKKSVCVYCKNRKFPNTKHCYLCKKCIKVIFIQVYDHHCKWLNNCIGTKNFKYFMIYLISANIECLLTIVIAVLNLTDYNKNFLESKLGVDDNKKYIFSSISLFLCSSVFIILSRLCYQKIKFWCNRVLIRSSFIQETSLNSNEITLSIMLIEQSSVK